MSRDFLELGDRVLSTKLAPQGAAGQLGTVISVHPDAFGGAAEIKTDYGIYFTACAKDSEWVVYVSSGIKPVNLEEII